MSEYTKEELLAEAKRRGLGSTGGAPTPTVAAPQGPSAQEFISGLPPVSTKRTSTTDKARSVLRGATLGLSDAVGSAAAAIPASFGSGTSLKDTYKDIRGTVQAEADEARATDPILDKGLEAAGFGGAMAASALPSATRAALARGAARVRGGAQSGAGRVAGAGSKPRVTVRGGNVVEPTKTGFKAALKKEVKDAASGGAVGAAAGELVTDDPMGGLLAGVAINNPLGRWALSRVMGNLFGDKARVMTYVGSHPATRRQSKRLKKALKQKLKRGPPNA